MIAGLKRVAITLCLMAALAVAAYYGWRWYDVIQRPNSEGQP